MSPRFFSLTLALLASPFIPFLPAQDEEEAPEPVPLVGRVDGNAYVSPTGAFRIQIPVLLELGGQIQDTENVVTFQDGFTTHASVACFPLDAALRLEDEMIGRREFLRSFFQKHVGADFLRRYPEMTMGTPKLLTKVEDGALLISILLPGGSMFNSKIFSAVADTPPTAKRGIMIFVKNDYVFLLSTELAEKVLESMTFKKTADQEDDMLKTRLMDLYAKLAFTMPKKPAAEAKPAASAPAAK